MDSRWREQKLTDYSAISYQPGGPMIQSLKWGEFPTSTEVTKLKVMKSPFINLEKRRGPLMRARLQLAAQVHTGSALEPGGSHLIAKNASTGSCPAMSSCHKCAIAPSSGSRTRPPCPVAKPKI